MTDDLKCWCGGDVEYEPLSYDNGDGGAWVATCTAQSQHDPLDIKPTRPPRTLYIAGPMTGYPECNFPEFYRVAAELQAAGYTTVNPADNNTGASYREILKGDLRMLLDCDGVALLDGWSASVGARLEAQIAGTVQMPVKSYREWIDDWLLPAFTENNDTERAMQ